MKLDVTNLLKAPFGQKESFNVELFNEQIDDEILAERTKGELTLTKLEDEILAIFKGSAKLKTVCDRCLSEYIEDEDIDFSQSYGLNSFENDAEKLPLTKDFKIDILEPLRQEIIARMPTKRLCQKNCAGICPNCGKNLNTEKCICKKANK